MRNIKIKKEESIAVLLMLMMLVIASAQRASSAAVWLEITVATDKQKYGLNEDVYVSGSLTWQPSGVPVRDELVGVEVRDSSNLPFAFRTRPTGSITTQNWLVNITELFPCDSNGNPKYSFKRGSNLYIFFRIKNFDPFNNHTVIVCITLFDANLVPIGSWFPLQTTLDPDDSKAAIFPADRIPTSASLGNATIYGNAYSDLPKNGGTPYCPEATATFTITGSTTSMGTTSTTMLANALIAEGTYESSFKLPASGGRLGNYTVYASAYREGYTATANVTFQVFLKGDVNGDGAVDIFDAILVSMAFGSSPGAPNWDPRADIDGSGTVDIFDAIMLSLHFGDTAT